MTVLYIYTSGLFVAFVMSCILATYYEYVRKDPQDWRYIASFSLMSWLAVVLMLINYRKQFIHLFRVVRRKLRRWIWKFKKSNSANN